MKVLQFSASWCSPCKMLQQTVASATLKYPVQYIDVDTEIEMTQRFSIRGVPTLVMLDDIGNEVKRCSGCMNKAQLEAWVND